jgi:hypothetical protein
VYDGGVRYDETNESAVDLDIKLKWLAAGVELRCVPEYLFTYRRHAFGQETGQERQKVCVEKIRREWRARAAI